MRIAFSLLLISLLISFGCAITNYPIITDDRGDYSGIIRTGHKAYVTPSAQVGTIYPDGSDELFSLVYQNQYGDQSLYTFNNFDPTAATVFLEQTYCDWKFEDCEIARAWNPIQNDDDFDYEFFEDCSGARSLSLLLSVGTRIGECGDNIFAGDPQAKARLFANLETTTWRGELAYLMPLRANNFWLTLTNSQDVTEWMPIYGQHDLILTNDIQLLVPMRPNMSHQLDWLNTWIAQNGNEAGLWVAYRGVQGWMDIYLRPEGVGYNSGRL